MSKQDLYRFNLRFDEDDEDHQKVCAFLNACGRKKARYIVKAFLAYWGKSEENPPEKQQKTIMEEKEADKEDDGHLVNLETTDYSTDQAEVSLMMKNYQMFDSLGKED